MEIFLAYSDDADDEAMFYAIAKGYVGIPGVSFRHFRSDIQTLNGMAERGEPDVCAVSVVHVPKVAKTYDLLPHGGSVGRGYGPVVVALEPDAPMRRIAVPGKDTTAAAVVRLAAPEAELIEVVGATLADSVAGLRAGAYDAAVLVHEGRLVYQDAGLHLLLDLGAWWEKETSLPLPLGANVIRSSLDRQLSDDLIGVIGESIRWATQNRDELLDAMRDHGISRGLDRAKLSHYLDLYANEDTAGYDETCQQAIWELLRRIK